MQEILDLLNKVQKLNSASNGANMQANNLQELEKQIAETENQLLVMKQNKEQFKQNIDQRVVEKEIIQAQVETMFEMAKKKLQTISNFDEKDPEFSDKINTEINFIDKLNIAEKLLGKELTAIPRRTIGIQSEQTEQKEVSAKQADLCDL